MLSDVEVALRMIWHRSLLLHACKGCGVGRSRAMSILRCNQGGGAIDWLEELFDVAFWVVRSRW